MKKNTVDKDYTLLTLLDLDKHVFYMENGYWVKFEVWRVRTTKYIPHGIRYSLTLHNDRNLRVVGYDNAHSLPKTKRHKAWKQSWDHVHKKRKIYPYEFDPASQLLEDFWNTVEGYV